MNEKENAAKFVVKSLTLGQTTRPSNNQQEKINLGGIVDIAVPEGLRVKMKENEKKDKSLCKGIDRDCGT